MKKNPSKPKKKVAYFSGCNMDFVFADTSENVVKVLQSLGMEVVYPMEQACCGKPILGIGDREATAFRCVCLIRCVRRLIFPMRFFTIIALPALT